MKNLHVTIIIISLLALCAACNEKTQVAQAKPAQPVGAKPKAKPAGPARNAPPADAPVIVPDPELEKNTVIKESTIPGAGMGAFAAREIKVDEHIGHYGGRLLRKQDRKGDDEYTVLVPKCAKEAAKPYVVIDGRGSGANMSRVNFAPYEINGKETGLQNARIHGLCKKPYIAFTARRDIKKGEELFTSYGANYGYHHFMNIKAVQDHFCKRARIDCSKGFTFKPCKGCPDLSYRK